MFRRRQTADVSTDAETAAGGKGRATPTRREAEAARKERAKPQQDRRSAGRAQRGATAADRAKAREAMARGDERYMLARDRGPVRKFARDYVDSKLTVGQYMLPAVIVFLVLSLVLGRASTASIREYTIIGFYVFILYVAIDTIMLTVRLKRIAAARFPEESVQGIGFYGAMRALQVRRLRQPKPKVTRGQPI